MEIFQTMSPPPPPRYTIGTIRKPLMSKVHQGGFIMLRLIMQELLNIEQYARVFEFFSKKILKIKTKHFREIGASSWYCWIAFDGPNLLELIHKF
jgi:hypothetical protein